jgi:hypothetical protein
MELPAIFRDADLLVQTELFCTTKALAVASTRATDSVEQISQ